MVAGRVLRATGCPNCRISIVRSFASLAGPHIRTPRPSTRPQYPTFSPRARFSSNVAQRNGGNSSVDEAHASSTIVEEVEEVEDAEEVEEVEGVEEVEEVEGVEESPGKEESVEVSAVPWYLQVDTPKRAPQPLSERQRLPALPESPPPILQPVLQHLSVDLGLDNLSLIDLRKLDPPPALGANLMMIIGTTRSERHLHVSADRFCRWLRSTYGLRPDADGLLGRNELKMKLRRKARRAKLLGNATEENEDDGVQTGWICVDMGAVESADPVPEDEPVPKDFVGFGRRTDGVTMVVQMLTEEKREEIDLEGLWGGVLRRGLRHQIQESEDVDGGEISSPAAPPTTGRLSGNVPPSMPPLSRGFHTSAFRPSTQPGVHSDSIPSHGLAATDASPMTSTSSALDDVRQQLAQSFASGKFDVNESFFLPFTKDIPQFQNNGWKIFLFEQMQAYLESIPKAEAFELLSADQTVGTTTTFMANFPPTLPAFPSPADGKVLIDNHCLAMEIGNASYTLHGLMALVRSLQDRAVPISPESYLRVLRSALRNRTTDNLENTPRESIDAALAILQSMHDLGHKVLTEQIFLTMQEALASEKPRDNEKIPMHPKQTPGLQRQGMSSRQKRVHSMMMAVEMPPFQDETRLQLLDLYSRNQHWFAFWDVWRMSARRGRPQSARMYAFMFRRVAEANNQKKSITALRVWVPEMDRENPKVVMEGDVAEAVKALVRVADPYAEQAAKDPAARGEWIDLWRRATQGSGV